MHNVCANTLRGLANLLIKVLKQPRYMTSPVLMATVMQMHLGMNRADEWPCVNGKLGWMQALQVDVEYIVCRFNQPRPPFIFNAGTLHYFAAVSK